MQPITIDVIELIKICSIIGGGCFTIGGLIYGYAKLNSKVDNTHRDLEKLDTKTAEALNVISKKMDAERERLQRREDAARDKMDGIQGSLSNLHMEVLKALGEKR